MANEIMKYGCQVTKLTVPQKMKIAEDLFNLAYKVKSFRLRSENPTWTPEQVHEKTIELIDRGCR